MADLSEERTEERTEPVSVQSEVDVRSLDEPTFPLDDDGNHAVSLDSLQVEGHHNFRILVRPLTKLPGVRSISPGSDNCQWLALRAPVSLSEHKVLAVTQTANDIKFSVRIPGESSRPPLWCELYYDPAGDSIICLNRSDLPISLVGAPNPSLRLAVSPPPQYFINPGFAKSLGPGTWRILARSIAVLEFRVLERRPVTVYQIASGDKAPSSSIASPTSGKRLLTSENDGRDYRDGAGLDGGRRLTKKRLSDARHEPDDEDVVMFLNPAQPLNFPSPNKELSVISGHALVEAQPGDTISVPGVCEVQAYQLTKGQVIASTAQSAVYKAAYSKVPGKLVTVKVLKTCLTESQPMASVRQAETWLRESSKMASFDSSCDSIVRFYGGDARMLSMYLEFVDAADLAAASWRSKTDDFTGTWEDAWRILADISLALHYIHQRKLVHNDIKPANILYSPERGAVLCDFGLLNSAASPAHTGGTPYYVPPEFIGTKLRGPPSDVWALGVTMLYALRRIPLPDSRARLKNPKRLYWLISAINNPSAVHNLGNGQPAVKQMGDWLKEICEAQEKLNSRDRLQRIVREMLHINPTQRITMAMVLQELQAEQTVAVR
ncbi:hypothetical protein CDD80_4173 [Ophiocordyceps camponoti-rufipedis]|uniref:Protein kinase domain-containing protein n=1 Tax=Ophiocordyceps camponoti-rufipedis TaxID=2004952 RepID=A0A2C5YVZ8_9HYPO|nr:hypothetical protein CDD80_4173 [Ophiocordyceps camponoti-rufipedis]